MPKVVLDPIYSAKPSHCASARKMALLVEHTLSRREDVFFHWLIPENLPEEEKAWFPQHPNVVYWPYPYNRDRVREYQVFTRRLEDVYSFNGLLWDTDVYVTMRTQQVPNMKIVMTSPRQKNMAFLKRLVLFEEMPIMSFKPTVAVSDERVQDLATLAGYVSADDVLITIQHEKDGILNVARRYLAASQIRDLTQKITVASPAKVDTFELKQSEFRFQRGTRQFTLGYTGRMTPSMSNLDQVYEIADKNWIMKGDKGFRMVFSTVSVTCKKEPPPFCEVVHLPREEFWKLVKTGMDLVLCLDVDAGFGMSLFEPLMFGTPVVVPWKDWSRALLGDQYPFFAKGFTEAYAIVKAFHDHYESLYATFAQWQQQEFPARFREGGHYGLNYTDTLYGKIDTFQQENVARYREQFPRKALNEIVQLIAKQVEGRESFVLHDVLKELAEANLVQNLRRKLDEDRMDRGIVWSTAWNDFRMALMAHYGFVDASPQVGHLRRA